MTFPKIALAPRKFGTPSGLLHEAVLDQLPLESFCQLDRTASTARLSTRACVLSLASELFSCVCMNIALLPVALPLLSSRQSLIEIDSEPLNVSVMRVP